MGSEPASEKFDYFEHDADIGVIGRGATPEQAMEEAARAMFLLMALPSGPEPTKKVEVAFEEEDPEFAFVTWLNGVLAECRTQHIFPTTFSLRHNGSRWTGEAEGEPWDNALEQGVEVKGATLTGLSLAQVDDQWEARCVVDV
ncbi:MAG: archease [Dehalococcoidia bacterium]|nr:archease [Dehalococcoidia bacterium]